MEVGIDWKNPLDREGFEKSLRDHRARRLLWTPGQKTVWVAQIFLLQLVVIGALYGSVAYNLVNNELDLKASEEEKIKNNWTNQVGEYMSYIKKNWILKRMKPSKMTGRTTVWRTVLSLTIITTSRLVVRARHSSAEFSTATQTTGSGYSGALGWPCCAFLWMS